MTRIAVLLKPVPETTGLEGFGPDLRVNRTGAEDAINPYDEYALEAALRLVEGTAAEIEIVLVSMAPTSIPDPVRKGLAMGAHRAVVVSDPLLQGSDTLSTTRVLAAALATLHCDLVMAGSESSDGRGGVVPAGIATLLQLPYLSNASSVELAGLTVRVRRPSATGSETVETPLPALVCMAQITGEPRYPSLRGIMAARSKIVAPMSLSDLGLAADGLGGGNALTKVISVRRTPPRGPALVVDQPPADAAKTILQYLRQRGFA